MPMRLPLLGNTSSAYLGTLGHFNVLAKATEILTDQKVIHCTYNTFQRVFVEGES